MPTTYTNGLKLPDLGSIDWFNAYKNNIDILDPIVGTVNGVATTYAPISHSHSASEITSGTIDIARLPPAALERLTTVADQTARYALTTSNVQLGDTVKQLDTGIMYLVVDTTKLNSADGYVEYSAGTASKAIADEDGTSIKSGYVNVAGNQTVTGDKSFTGSNTFNNILPNATNTYSLGSSSYQWASVYAQSYYYNGTAWGLDKANVWTGNNIFNKRADPASITSATDTTLAFNGLFNTIFLNTRGSSNRTSYGSFLFVGYGTTGADNYGQIQLLRSTDKRGDTNDGYVPDTSFKLWRVAPHYLITDFMEAVRVTNDGTENSLKPITNNTTDLGTSTNKWKTLNGINPGALGMPSSSYVEIDTTNWDLTGASSQSYTPAVHGWLYISIQNIAGNYLSISGGRGAVSMDGTGVQAGLGAMLPAVANESVSITVKTGSIFAARFYPMLGNV